MSANAMPESWKLTLPCTRAEAEAINAQADVLSELNPPPALLTREETVDDPDDWRLDVFFEGRPGTKAIAAVRALVPSAAGADARPERLADTDWVTLSQAGLDPVGAGQFFVHTSTFTGDVPAGKRAFRIEASRAFGTGHHETTTGCLTMIDAIRRRGGRVDNLIDIGTGTGLLAFAAMSLWPRAYATASDIDPVSIAVAEENAAINGVPLGGRQGRLALTVADGTEDPLIARRAPYDLIVANILAAPLITLAPGIAAIARPGAQVVLAGVLRWQAPDVVRAYRRQGFRLAERVNLGDWTILRLRLRLGR